MNLTRISEFFVQAVMFGVPLLYGAVGEILTEKVGHLNLGIPGIMYVGGISGIIGGYFWETSGNPNNTFMCILCSLLSALAGSALMAFVYAFLTITLRANQNVTGLVLTTFGLGLGSYLGSALAGLLGTDTTISLNATSAAYKKLFWVDIKLFGSVFVSFGFLTLLAIVIAITASFVLQKTRVGLNLRAVGESPATADAAGINVIRYKYAGTVIGGAIAGLGGLYYVMDFIGGSWSNGGFDDRGWLAVALVIFAIWRPKLAIPGSILFGGLYILYSFIPNLPRSSQEIFKVFPYLVTIIVLILTSVRKKKENLPPASLGLPYFREDR